MIISAVESGPPDTASTRTGKFCRPAKSVLSSDAETAFASAVRTLLFLRHAALHTRGRARIFAPDLGQRRASCFLLVHRGERLTKPQERVRRLAGMLEFGGNGQKGLGGVAIALLL